MTPEIATKAVRAALFAACVIGAAGIAQEPPEETIIVRGKPLPEGTETRIVKISDLNLSDPEGEKEMNRRVGVAVDSICNQSPTSDLPGQRLDKTCRDNAWAGARPQMDRALQLAKSR